MSLKRSASVSKHMQKIDEAKVFIEEMLEKRQGSFDNKSDKWKEGEKAEEEEQNLSDLEEIKDDLEEIYGKFENLFEE